MVTERLDVRLDPDRRRKLEELAADREASVSDTVRGLIDDAYAASMHAKRKLVVERLIGANVGEPLEPDELKRLIDEAASPGDLH